MSYPITFEDIEAAERRIRPYLAVTPLRRYPPLSRALGANVWVKHENHQPTNAFKVRNALSALTRLDPADRSRGVVAATRGNHGAGLAWAGELLDVPVVICVPRGNNPEKNEMILSFGAELVEEGETYDAALRAMDRLVEERGLIKVHATNDAAVVAGAGTMALEMLRQAGESGHPLDAVVLAVGGGSQAVGALVAARGTGQTVDIYGVGSAAAPAQFESYCAGAPRSVPPEETLADGVATGSSYELTRAALHEGLRDFVIVDEDAIARAMRLLMRTTHALVEGAGALGAAGIEALGTRLRGKTVGIVISGGNVDQATLARVVAGAG